MTSREALLNPIAVASRNLYRDTAARMSVSVETPGDAFMQIGKSLLSIGSNWVESLGRRGSEPQFSKDALRFLRFARGSAWEAAFQLDTFGWSTLAERAHDLCDAIDAEFSRILEAQTIPAGEDAGNVADA